MLTENTNAAAEVTLEPGRTQMPRPLIARGRSRYVCAAGIIAIVISVSALLVEFDKAQSLWVAATILIVSLLGFHAVALLTSDCARCWRCVDYPWVLATFMTILIALTNIQETARLEPMKLALADRRAAYDGLTYSLKSVITNDCHPKASRAGMWEASPEPYTGACDRIEHFLPQIERAAAEETTPDNLNSGAYWGANLVLAGARPVGSWAGLYDQAARFTESGSRTQTVLGVMAQHPASPIAAWARSDALKYWFFVLTFFLGLRLAKISAELLATRETGIPRVHGAIRRIARESFATTIGFISALRASRSSK